LLVLTLISLLTWLLSSVCYRLLVGVLAKRGIDLSLGLSPSRLRLDHFAFAMRDMKDNILDSFSIRLSRLRPTLLGFFRVEVVLDCLEVDLRIYHLDLELVEDLSHWQKNARKFHRNCEIIRGEPHPDYLRLKRRVLLRAKAKQKVHRDSGEISLLKVVKNYLLRILIILLSKVVSLRLREIRFRLALARNPSPDAERVDEVEFLSARVRNLTVNQIYSKNERFIFHIAADNAKARAFSGEAFSEKKASLHLVRPGRPRSNARNPVRAARGAQRARVGGEQPALGDGAAGGRTPQRGVPGRDDARAVLLEAVQAAQEGVREAAGRAAHARPAQRPAARGERGGDHPARNRDQAGRNRGLLEPVHQAAQRQRRVLQRGAADALPAAARADPLA
ncbi:MAG: hypothetical protein AAF368_00870, partial [Planctomycetota bacterium]